MNRIRVLLFLSIIFSCVASTRAQNVSIAPLPSQLATAKTVFISNACDQDNANCLRAYNMFYVGIASLNRVKPVLNPADADLILALNYSLVQEFKVNGGRVFGFNLAIIDPKTHVCLWTIVETEDVAMTQSSRDKNLDTGMAALVADFNKLTGPAPTPPDQHNTQHTK